MWQFYLGVKLETMEIMRMRVLIPNMQGYPETERMNVLKHQSGRSAERTHAWMRRWTRWPYKVPSNLKSLEHSNV